MFPTCAWHCMHFPYSGYDCGVFVVIYMDLLALKVESMCFTQKDVRMLWDKCPADILSGTIRNFPVSLSSWLTFGVVIILQPLAATPTVGVTFYNYLTADVCNYNVHIGMDGLHVCDAASHASVICPLLISGWPCTHCLMCIIRQLLIVSGDGLPLVGLSTLHCKYYATQ